MGANHPGEIKALCEIAEPDSGLITNIGKAHLEGFGSFDGVVKTKSELFNYIVAHKGIIFCNGADKLLRNIVNNYQNCALYNTPDGISGRIIASAPTLKVELTYKKNQSTVNTHLYGDYNFTNILAAARVGIEYGITLEEIKTGIEKYHPTNYRSQLLEIGSSVVIMDCYNANPTSMEEALQNAANFKANRKIIILGGMKELGSFSNEEHKKLFKLTENYSFDEIILFGEEFKDINPDKGISTVHFDELVSYIRSIELQNSLILIKGSRTNRLERLESVISDYLSSNS